MKHQFHLITNLTYVTIRDLRLHANAVVLEDDSWLRSASRKRCQMRLFGPDPAWPVVDVEIPTIEHEIQRRDDGRHNLFLDWGQDPVVLETSTWDSTPPAAVSFAEGTPIERVWEALTQQTAFYWQRPAMPTLQWGPPGSALGWARRHR